MKMIFTGKVSGEKTVLAAGARHTVKAQAGERYGLVDEVTGLVPDGVEADRSGDDLILRKKEDDTEVRIEGFWEECQPGETQCTAVFNIVGEDGQVTEAVLTQDGPVLDDITAGQSGTLSDDDRGGFIWLGGLAFGGGLAAMALAAGGGGSKHRHENDDSDTTAPSSPALKAEDDGSVSVVLPGDANKGDTVEITFEDEKGGKHTVTLEKGDNGWTSSDPTLIPDSNGDKVTIPADNVKDNSEVTAIAKDPSGNESDPSTVTSKTDGVADAPVLSIPEVADGYANADELKDGLQAEVTLPAGTAEGAVITLTVTRPDKTTENVTHTVTKDEVAAGKVSMDIPKDAVIDGQNSVSVSLTQGSNPAKPGNVVDFTADTQIPGDTDGDGATDATPVVAIPEAADGVNAEELKDGVQTEVTVPKGSAAGDTLTLTVTKPDGTTDTVEHTLTADEVTAGKAAVTIPADKVTADGQYSVTAEITDPAGNTSGQGQPTDFTVDTQIPGDTDGDGVVDATPVVTIPEAADGVNAEELKDGVQTEVTVPKGSAAGDTLTLTVTKPDGTTDTVEHTLTADEVTAGKADVTIPADKVTADGQYSVTAEITDPAGNTSGQGQPADFAVDTVAPSAPVLKAEDDGSVSVDLPGDANKGDTVDVTFEDEKGGKHTVTLEKGDNGWTSSDPTLIPDSNGDKATIPADNVKDNSEVTAIAKDPSGNESDPSTVTSKTDGVADAPVLSIPEVADGYANADELKDGLQAEVTLPAGTAEGAVITLTVTRPDKTTENVTHTVTKDEVAAGKVSMDIPKDAVIDGQNSVSVSLTQGSNPAKPGNVVDFTADTQIPGDTDGDGATDATPVVAIPEAADGVNAEELKDGVQTEVTVPKGSAAGDTLTLTVTKPDGTTDTVEHTLTADEVTAGKAAVTIPADKVTADGQYSVTAEITDPAGNTSGQGQPTDFTVDTQIPGDTDGDGVVDATPVVTIPEAADGVNAEELKDGVQTEVTVPKGSAAGDTLTLTVTKPDGTTDTVEHTLTADEVTAGKADVTIPADKVTADGQYSVTAEITDPAGNTSGQGQPADFAVDTVAPSAPVLKAEDDGSVSVELPGDANKGDTVDVTFEDEKGGKHTVTLEKGDNGWTSSDPTLIPDSTGDKATIPADNVKDNSEVTGVAKDPSGNESDPSTVTSKTDGVADAPVLSIPEVADGYANADELKDGLQAEVTLPAGTAEGAVITLTVTRPDKTTENVTHTVTKDEVAAGKVSMDIPKDAVIDGQNSVSVSLTQGSNPAKPGNVVDFTADTQIPGDTDGDGATDATPVVAIPEAADGVNAEELKDGVQTEVTVPKGSAAGDTLTLTVTKPDGTTDTVEHTLTADEVTAGKAAVTIPADKVTADGQYSVTAEITDPAGNTSGQGQPTDFTVDTQIPGDTDGDGVVDATPVVTIPEAADGVNAEELKDGVQTEVTVPKGSAAGDTLTLTVTKPDGTTDTVEHTLTADEVTAGKADVTIPADKVTADGQYSVTAEITDPAGNTSGQGQPADFAVDTVAPSAPVLKAEDDGSVSVDLPGDANKGDTVDVTFEDEKGGKHTVTLEKGDNGWTSSDPTLIPDSNGDKATIPADNVKDNSEVTAIAKDPSGNESDPSTVTSKTDGVADAPVLSIPEVADGYANADELKDGLQAEVTLPAGTAEGAVITLTVTRPDKTTENVTHTVTKDEVAAGKVSMDIPKDAVIDGQNSVSVSLTQGSNPAKPGNVVDFTADTQIPGDTDGDGATDATPVVAIPEAADGVNAEELKDGVQTEVTVPKGSAAGDTLTLTVTKPDGTTDTVEHTLTADEVTAGKAAVTIPADKVTADGQYSVTAEITDPAGNTSGQGQPTDFTVDTQIPGDTDGDGVVDATPVVTIPEAADGVNAEELKDGVQTEVTVPKGSAAGDTLTLTVTKPDGTTDTVEHTLTADEVTAGKADVTIPADKVTADGQYSVTAEITDPAGNTSGQGQPADFAVDTVAPSAPVLKAEDDGSVSVELPGDANKGDTVDVTFEDEKGGKHTVTLEKGDNGWTSSDPTLIPDSTGDKATIPADNVKDNSEVTGVAKDPSGNESDPSTVTSKTDGVADAPVLSIPEVADGYANADELKDGLQAEVTLPAGTAEGAVITLTVTRPDKTTENVTHTVTKDEVAAGKVSMDIPKDAVIDGQNSVSVSLTQGSNPAKPGNVVDFTADTQIPGDTDGDGATDATPVVAIPEAADGVNAEELKDGVQTEVTVPKGSAAGDTLTLTVTKPDGTTDTVEHTLTADEVTAGKAAVTIPADKVTADGQYSVTAEITDPAGNTSGQGQPTDFTVDTQIPGDTDGDGVVDATPVVTIPEAADGVNAEELKDGVQTEVTVPKGSAAGDTLTLTVTKPDGTTDTVEHTLTADEVTAGKADVTIPADKVTADGQYSVTAEITDPAGNTSGQGQPADFAVDTVAPSAPVLKAEDDGSVSVDLPGDANKGDTVDVTFEDEKGGKHTVTLEKGDNGWTSSDPTLIPDSNGDKATIPADNVKDNSEVTAIAKDPSGNESDPSTVTSKTDGVADAPVLSIPEVADGYANADELKDGLQAEVTLPAGTAEGAVITLTVTRPDKTTENVTHTVTKDEVAAGKVSMDIPKDAVIDGQNSVSVSLTQGSNPAKPGNVVDFTADTQIPGDTDGDGATDATPVVAIPEAADGVNAEELKDGVQTEVTVPKGSAAGDTLTLTVTKPDGTTDTVEHTLTADEVTAGKAAVTIPADKVTADGQYSVTAEITDPAGNTSGQGQPTDFTVDTQISGDTDGDGVVDATPVVTIPEAADGVNAEELKDGVQTEVTVPKGSAAGDTLTLTVTKPDGTTDTVEHTLTADEVTAGKADVTIPADKVTADGQYSVTAEITDPAGNTSGQGQPADFAVDTVAPSAPVLKAEDDGSVSVELPGDANKGDTVDVTFEDEKGGKHTVTLEKGDNGWTSSDPTLIPDSTGDKATIPADNVKDNSEVTGVAKDPSGNESDPSTVTSKTDGVADAPVLSIPEVADGYANADELKDGLQAEVTLPAGTAEGAVITLTVTRPDKTTENVTHTVTKDEVAAGKVSMDIPKDAVIDGQNSVSVSLTQGSNPAKPGNVVDFTADTQIPGDTDGDGATDATPVVAIPEAADGVNAEELKDGVQTEVTVPKGSAAGDTLTLTVTKPDGTTDTVEHTLTADEVTAGKAAVTIPADKVTADGQYSVTAEITDPAGNTSGQGQPTDFTVDTQIPGDTDGDGVVDATPVVTIPEAADGVNAEELKDGVQTEVTVPKGSAAGDTLTLTVTKPDGTTDTVEHTLTADEVTAGKAAVTIPADKVTADGQYSVTAEITDPAGNTSGQGQPTDFTVDTQIPGDTDGDGVVDATPVVTIPEAADGVNAEELKDGVQTEVTVPKGSAAGDTLTLTVTKPDGTTDTVEHTLTADEVTAGKADVTIPADKVTADGQYSVTAEITDPAGNTSGQGQPADFAVDTVAPSAPVLKAEDDGSVSVELPGDANKGDTVDVTFEDEKGGKHTVTLEKGDNGWTSSDPTLIPDSTGDKATIPADNVKDNSEVTGVAKDPSGNESDPSTVTSKTDVLPTVSISVETTSTDVNGDGFTGIVSVNGTVMDVPATIEDKDDSTGLVYTVSLNHVTTTDVTVTVTLGSGAGHSDAADYSDIGGAQHNGKIGLHGDTGKVTYDGATTVTIVIPAGSKSVSFIVDPTLEANQDAFNAEGMEKVVATITGTSDNVTAATDIVDNAGASATGVIYDGNAISLRNLDGDFTLKYSLSSSVAEKGDFGYTIGANSGENDPMVTTDYSDTVYVGYYQSGKETTSYSNVANSLDNGPDGTKTDGNQSITTVDLGAGDDLMVIRGNMLDNTRVYTGEGNDTFTMDGMNTALRVMYAGSYIFTESGDDIVTIKRTGVTNAGQIYLGSGSDTFIQGDATDNNDTKLSGLLDLGSGTKDISNMPKEYLSVYQDGSNLSLGNDNNIDTATDVNTVTIYGSVSGEILGGYGSDNITVTKNLTGNISVGDNADTLTAGWIYGGATVSMGDGNDTVTVTDGAYNTTISLGAGDDVFDSTGATLGSAATTIDGGEGNDTIKIGTISNGNITIDAGAGDDIVVLTKDYDTKPVGNQGSINGGEGSDTLVLAGNISVNLATGKNEGIAGFEKVDMTVGSDLKAGNTAQLVKLTASDVLGMNDNSTIYISGDANDKVDLGAAGAGSLGTFTATATTVKATALDGIEHTYTLYSSVSGANVYIDNNIIDASGVI